MRFIWSKPSDLIYLRTIQILTSNLGPCLPRGFFPSIVQNVIIINCSRDLKNSPSFRLLITVTTKFRISILSSVTLIQLREINSYVLNPCLVLPSGDLLSGFPTKILQTLCNYCLDEACYMYCPSTPTHIIS